MGEKRIVWFHHYETKKDENSDYLLSTEINYSSKTKVDYGDYFRLRQELKKYVTEECDFNKSHIVDVVKKIREITHYLEEDKLEVVIKRENSYESVYYENGNAESCSLYRKQCDDEVSVHSNYKGIDIKYKKSNIYLNSEDKIKIINSELEELYRNVIMLNNMKKNNEEDIKKFNLVNN